MSAFIKFYVYINFHIALCAMAFTAEYYLRSNQAFDIKYLLFILCSTLSLYCLHRIIGIKKKSGELLNNRMLTYNKLSKILIYVMLLSGLVAGGIFISLPIPTILLCILPIIISLFYALPIFKKKYRLRDFPFVKIFLIAVIWTWLCYYIPAEADKHISLTHLLECALFMILITLPFDIRDLEIDSSTGVKTIPSAIGINSTKILGTIIVLASCLLIHLQEEQLSIKLALVISQLLACCFLLGSNKNRNDLYYSFFIDGLLIVRFLFILVLIEFF